MWWGREDSNFQPNDYQPLALSIEQPLPGNPLDGYSATGAISRSGAVTSLVMALAATIERCCA